MSTRVDELAASRPLEMGRRKAEQIVTGLEDPINQHLLKLMAFEGAGAAPRARRAQAAGNVRLTPRRRLRPGPSSR